MDTDEWITRKRTVKPPVDVTITRPPGRRARWIAEVPTEDAELSGWRAEGASERAAADTLTARMSAFLANYRPPEIITFRGQVAVLSIATTCDDGPPHWQYEIIDGGKRAGSGGFSATSWAEAVADMRHNLAQRSTDWHDDASVWEAAEYLHGGDRFRYGQLGPAELLRYAAWQRAAKAAKDAGRADWHEWAGEHRDEFAVPKPAPQPPCLSGWATIDAAPDQP